ncbi:hypothetical protein ISN44_Un143g000240 (mitochondrion) [Arabidopsis suecica]|uniref:Uncharacterized protein n=1 Tax=Arabidopsis suecica TaxID=45249 RepID=A0A8T1XIP1_ARASU|nr:hypothetical protein ISN44_Un143g000240 [Arabidopsis suecica]
MSPEQSQYIWRKTIPHIEVGMGSGVFTSHRRPKARPPPVGGKEASPLSWLGEEERSPSRRIQSSHRFPYGYLVTTSPQSKTPPWYAPIRPPKAFVALVGPGTYSPRHADPRLLAIPTSCSRVAENNPN